MVQRLQHGDERRPSVAFLVHARAVIVQLDRPLLVGLGHLVHHPPEPLERALLSGHPVEVGPSGLERGPGSLAVAAAVAATLDVGSGGGLGVEELHVVDNVLEDADEGRGSDA